MISTCDLTYNLGTLIYVRIDYYFPQKLIMYDKHYTHWLVSVKFDSHLVSGSLFFQGVHKNIFETV